MSKKSEQYEHDVSEYINSFPGVEASRPPAWVNYSDVKVTYNDNSTWLEVKMNHTDNLGNTRCFYDGNKWCSSSNSPLASFCTETLNCSVDAERFVSNLSEFANIQTPEIPTTKSGLKSEKAIPLVTMHNYFKENNLTRYIVKEEGVNLGDLVTEHYLYGKKEAAYYMQAGDDFYMIGDENPLNLNTDIPKISGFGDFKMRVSIRSKFYEIQPEVKIRTMPFSEFSLKPGTKKKSPFE